MKVNIPSLEQYTLQAVDEVRFSGLNEELKFSVEITPQTITKRVLVGLIDQHNVRGMAVAIYPATGEVCDVSNEGGVIGYLSQAPLNPGAAIHCELNIFKFGKNFVCSAVIDGETFLYPAFRNDESIPMAAVVGTECHDADQRLRWNNLSIELQELNRVIAA